MYEGFDRPYCLAKRAAADAAARKIAEPIEVETTGHHEPKEHHPATKEGSDAEIAVEEIIEA